MGSMRRMNGLCSVVLSSFGFMDFWAPLVCSPTVAASSRSIHSTTTFNVLTWKDIMSEEIAWDTFVWFSISRHDGERALNGLGFIHWFSLNVITWVEHYPWHLASGERLRRSIFIATISLPALSPMSPRCTRPFSQSALLWGAPPMLAAFLWVS